MQEPHWIIARSISIKVAKALFGEQEILYNLAWEVVRANMSEIADKPIAQWKCIDINRTLLDDVGFADDNLLDRDLLNAIAIVTTVVVHIWGKKPQPSREIIIEYLKSAEKGNVLNNNMLEELALIFPDIYGSVRETVMSGRKIQYRVVMREKEGMMNEEEVLKLRHLEKWDFWISKNSLGIELIWKGSVVNLRPQCREFVFLLSKDHERGKEFESLYQLFAYKKHESPKALHTLKCRCSSDIKLQYPDLAQRIVMPTRQHYSLNLSGISYCISEIVLDYE